MENSADICWRLTRKNIQPFLASPLFFIRGFRYRSFWQRIFFDADTPFRPAFPVCSNIAASESPPVTRWICIWLRQYGSARYPPAPPGSERYPGLRGNEEVSLAEFRDLRQKGETLQSICRDLFQIFLRGRITYCVGGVKRALCGRLLPGPREPRHPRWINPGRACTRVNVHAINSPWPPSRIVLTHSLLSTSDWQSL